MKISKETITINDSVLTLRAPETQDAMILLDFLKKVSGETPYLIRTEEEVNIPLEKEISFINKFFPIFSNLFVDFYELFY